VTTLFDSSVLIDHLRGRPAATELLVKCVAEGAALGSGLARVEIEGGMRSEERHVDYVIAATAREFGAELATLNLKQFPMFPDLRAPYPSK
jgi:predicted nucleic acid-binding protein